MSRGLGVFRDHLFATMFGADGVGIYSLDTYYAAFRVPDLLYSILIYGTISVAFMPIFSEHLAKQKHAEAWKFTSNVLNLLLLFFLIIAGGIFVFAQPLMAIFVHGFSPEQIEQTAQLVRIMLLSPLFFAIAAIAIGVENSLQKFTAQALAPVLYNLGIIAGALLWGKNFGVYGLVWGVVFGAFLYMAIQLPGLFQSGFRWFPILSFKRADTREMFQLVLPRLISLSAIQFNLIFDTFLGSTLAVGSLTVLNLAQNLQSLPYGIISISVAITSFSLFTKYAAEKNLTKFHTELQKSVRVTFYLLIPAILGMFLLRTEIIRVVLEGGNFATEATEKTASTLAFFLLALIAQGLIPLCARAFFALKNTKLPLLISLIAMFVNILFSFYFSKKMGVHGLALANAIGMWTNFILLYFFLSQKFSKILSGIFVIKTVCATTIMGSLIFFGKNLFPLTASNLYLELAYLMFFTIFGFSAYLFISHLLKITESHTFLKRILRKSLKSKV